MIWLALIGGILLLFGLVVFRGAPYVPTKPKDSERAFVELYPLSTNDVVLDIGSGDGMVLRAASRHGARAIGFELNPVLVLISKLLSLRDPRVSVRLADFWLVPFPPDTTVVYTFGESRDIAKMARRVQSEATRLARPLHFISYGFEIPDQAPLKKVGAHYLYTYAPLRQR